MHDNGRFTVDFDSYDLDQLEDRLAQSMAVVENALECHSAVAGTDYTFKDLLDKAMEIERMREARVNLDRNLDSILTEVRPFFDRFDLHVAYIGDAIKEINMK